MYKKLRVNSLLILCLLILSCTQVPEIEVWRPWTRTLPIQNTIITDSELDVEVSGATNPLIGSEKLLHNEITQTLKLLFIRRGFHIVDNNSIYKVKLEYNTERNKTFSSNYNSLSNNYLLSEYNTLTGTGITQGLGVSVATTLSKLISKSTSISKVQVQTQNNFIHTISIEIVDNNQKVIWKGESTWESNSIDIRNYLVTALQVLLSDLPSSDFIPHVQKIKQSHASNYYTLNCMNRWFACPALPYRIYFAAVRPADLLDNKLPPSIENVSALEAYVDLIQTAEYVLPKGSNNLNDPLNTDIWRKAQLGQQYYLGKDKQRVNILINLTGESDGYYIDKAWIATDSEYSIFQKEFNSWKEILIRYYDYYQ